MPWKEQSVMDVREEFCRLALQEGSNVRELCRRYGISPTTGYHWRERYRQAGRPGLADDSRRPHRSPGKTDAAVEAAIIALRQEHPAWGGRKLRAVLQRRGAAAPSASTITAILQRQGLLVPRPDQPCPPQRFCAPFPNDLWQMDYKGHFPLARTGRCHPLTVLDDHARYALGIAALANERGESVKAVLIELFRRYGLPNRILCDNGPPWGASGQGTYTALSVWLLHLDVRTIHGRPWHPQTQGKDERFHRTLVDEVLRARSFDTLAQAQDAFDAFRQTYNHIRPHEALGLLPPIDCYTPSPRAYPAHLPPIEYPSSALVRRVTTRGILKIAGRQVYLGEGFTGYPLALYPTAADDRYQVYFRHYVVGQIDLRAPAED
jgi:transposase InsO family protein